MAPTQTQILNRYRIHMLAAGRNRSTVALRLLHLEYLQRYNPDLLVVTRYDLEAYLAERRETHSAATRKSLRASFRTFYAWAAAEELVSVNPAEHLASIRSHVTPARVATEVDIKSGLAAGTVEDRAILLLARGCFLRRSEIAALHTSNRRGDLLIVTGKGQKTRRVGLTADALDALQRLEAVRDGFYFPGRVAGHRHPDSIYNVIKRLSGWHPHALRHAGASAAYQRTKDIRTLQEALGHSSLATTERYVTMGEDSLRAMAAASAIGAPPH